MNVLIVGGTGNISTPITNMLVERGDRVTVFNRGKTGSGLPAAVKQVVGDRKDYGAFERTMRNGEHYDAVIDMVCFLAEEAQSAVRAFRGRTEQYVFCSTVDVYTKEVHSYPIREDAERKPKESFPYAFEKAKCETLLFDAHEHGDFKLTVIRPAATYREGWGPIHPFRGGSYHLDRIEKGKPLILHGDGTSIWSACHSDDVARAFVRALGNSRAYGEAYHTTGEEWMTWNRYWQCVADAVGKPLPEVIHIPTDILAAMAPKHADWCRENFQHNNIFDNAKARADLEFRYTVKWAEGVKRSVDWIRAHGGFEDSDRYPLYDRLVEAWRHATKAMTQELLGPPAATGRGRRI